MYFDFKEQIREIAGRTGTAVFVVPNDVSVTIKNALELKPEGKSVISIEQVRTVLARLGVRQTTDLFVVIRPAEALGEEAANALLKALEEPGDKTHFVLITNEPSKLLPTVLSRAALYFLKTHDDGKIHADEKVKNLAKKLMVARGAELVEVAEEIGKKKDGVRMFALDVLGAAIEMLYKTYFITNKEIYVKKIPKFLATYDAISRNGHVKLQIVSNLC